MIFFCVLIAAAVLHCGFYFLNISGGFLFWVSDIACAFFNYLLTLLKQIKYLIVKFFLVCFYFYYGENSACSAILMAKR